jgi:G:T-mismatch repair DNA endonuclease (very short patch repair protein)
MPDVFTKSKRSAVMARIRSRGSRDWQNEARVANWSACRARFAS